MFISPYIHHSSLVMPIRHAQIARFGSRTTATNSGSGPGDGEEPKDEMGRQSGGELQYDLNSSMRQAGDSGISLEARSTSRALAQITVDDSFAVMCGMLEQTPGVVPPMMLNKTWRQSARLLGRWATMFRPREFVNRVMIHAGGQGYHALQFNAGRFVTQFTQVKPFELLRKPNVNYKDPVAVKKAHPHLTDAQIKHFINNRPLQEGLATLVSAFPLGRIPVPSTKNVNEPEAKYLKAWLDYAQKLPVVDTVARHDTIRVYERDLYDLYQRVTTQKGADRHSREENTRQQVKDLLACLEVGITRTPYQLLRSVPVLKQVIGQIANNLKSRKSRIDFTQQLHAMLGRAYEHVDELQAQLYKREKRGSKIDRIAARQYDAARAAHNDAYIEELVLADQKATTSAVPSESQASPKKLRFPLLALALQKLRALPMPYIGRKKKPEPVATKPIEVPPRPPFLFKPDEKLVAQKTKVKRQVLRAKAKVRRANLATGTVACLLLGRPY